MNRTELLTLGMVVAFATALSASTMDRPTGIKIGDRMTLRPYVSASVTYDSNVDAMDTNKNQDDILWTISPGLGLDYAADNWSLLLEGYYSYHCYTKSQNVSRHNEHSYGETLRWNWADSTKVEKGWSMMIMESFRKLDMAEEITLGDGSAYTGDRYQFDITGALQRRINENWHADVNANYYLLDYDNDTASRWSANYGWQRWVVGAEAGFAPSKWTDFLLSANYQGYKQDNTDMTTYGDQSHGFSVMTGLGSYMTERISYRALVGWSRFEYGEGASSNDGFVYSLSGSWKISDTWSAMLLGTSYYQPSERERATKTRVDAFSLGLAKTMVRGKLRATFDATYRHEQQERVGYYAGGSSFDYDVDIVSARLGLNYSLNRYLALFVQGEYQRSWNSESDQMDGYLDYDRFMLTGGVRLTY